MVGKVLYIKYKEIVDGQIVEKVRYAVDRWQADDKYMGESFITFTVKSSKPIAFSVGDYCEYRGETYTLNYIPSVSQRANIGGSGEAFVYEQVKMDSPREELDRAIMLDVTPTTGDYIAALGTNYTGSAQFQLYCGETTANGRTLTPVCALAAKMQANLDRAFPDKGWKVLVDTTTTHEEAGQQVLNTHSDEKTLTFDNTTIANALAEVKNTFEIDFAVKGRTIYIGYTFGAITGNNDGDYYYFGYGKGYLSEDNQGKALFELKRTSDSGQKIVTRLRALGSSKNMPYRYYNKKYNLSQSLFPMNLQLPDTFETPEVKAKHNKERKAVYPWIRDVLGDTNDAYIDKNDNCLDTVEGLREDCMRWDGTNADLKEIYPSIEEVTYGELRAALCEDQDGNKGSSAFPHYGNNERVDEILDIDTDTNVGDGILTESDSTRQTASDTDVRLTSSETSSSLAYNGSAYASKEVEVMSIASQYAGNYIISNSHLWFRASYSLGRHQSENITKTCKVAYRIKVYAKDLSTNKDSVICTYISDYKQISNREAKEYEVEIAKLPDMDAEVQKVDKITVTNPSDIRITFALLVMDIDYSYDQWNVNWNLGLSLYQTPDTDTEWTSSLIWDLEGSASTFMKNPFHVYVKDMGFDFVAAFGTSDTPRIAMKSGMCVAREFEIGNNPQKVEYTKGGITYKAWRLTLAKAEDSSLKTYYPSENFPLAAGDNFVIIGIEMPDVYIQAASMKLLVEATKALADVCDTKHEYEPSVDGIYIQRNYDRCEEEGDVTKSVYWKLGAGMKFPFFGIAEEGKDTPDMFSMIIDTLSIREGEGLTPNISIKLSEDFQQSTLQKLTRTVTSITNGSIFKATNIGNGGGLDESSVRAIVSEFTKRRFLSKLNPDTAKGIITFLQGLVSEEVITAKEGLTAGTYMDGLYGSGASIDKIGNAVFESIYARSFISAPEFRYNRILVTEGEQWNTNGYGMIESVDTDNRIIVLHLEENDYASVVEGDYCRGIYNNIGTTEEYQNLINIEADDCGFPMKAGFFTSYFRVSNIIESSKGKCSFRYELRNSKTPHPCAQMKFAQYTNDIDETRQASAYFSSVGHFYFQAVEKVSSWVVRPENVTIRFGWIDGFPAKLKDGSTQLLRNYGLYVPDNIYFGNAIVQIDAKSVENIKTELKQYSIEISNAVDVITVDDAGNVIGGLYKLNPNNTKYDYRISPAVYVKKGNDYLVPAEYGDDSDNGTYKMYITPKNCTAELINGTICVTSIDNIKDGISGTSDDTEFDYEAMRKTESISVVISAICEGIGSISKEYHVAIKHDSQPYIRMDLDKEFSAVSWNTKNGAYVGLPLTITLSAWRNDSAVDIYSTNGVTGISVAGLPDGAEYTKTINSDGKGVITITSLPEAMNTVTPLSITASVSYAGILYERTLKHTINRFSDTNIYTLETEPTAVTVRHDTAGEPVFSAQTVACKVVCRSSDDDAYEVSPGDYGKLGISITYLTFDTDGNPDAEGEKSYTEPVPVSADLGSVRFTMTENGVMTYADVPLVLDGIDGKGIEYVYMRNNDEKTAPTLIDKSATDEFQSDAYCPPASEGGEGEATMRWTDNPVGVSQEYRCEWVAKRTKKYGKWGKFSEPTIWAKWGEKGDNAVEYSLKPNMTSIIIDDNNKIISGDSLSVTLYKTAGSSTVQSNDYKIFAYYVNNDGTKTVLGPNSGFPSPSKMTITSIADDLAAYYFEVHDSNSNILAVLTIPVVRHGKPSMSIVDRGLFDKNSAYYTINGGYSYKYVNGTLVRDMVKFLSNNAYYYYMVKNRTDLESENVPVKESPDDASDEWEQASKYNLLVADVIYADNATFGGFHVDKDAFWTGADSKDNATILLDGKYKKVRVTGEVNATSGVFQNVKITNNCWIEPETENGDGWFMRGGNDRIPAWWLGYSGKLTGQFTMNTVYDNGSNHPPTASLSFMTPNIQQGGKPDGSTLISAYSNINTPLANFSHAKGMMVRICPSEGVGIYFINNAGLATPVAFNGTGHGCLNGVIQGYQLNVITSGQIDISKGNTVYCNGNGTNLILPTRENCSNVLGTTGAFALDLTIIGASGASNFRVYGKYHDSTTDCYLLNNNHGDNWYATMSQGDVLQLKLIYTGSAFYAYIVSLMQ
ncbi:MAG: hypothetical protein MR717_11245 [Prevotella sp.]|nr:hypothetical protein [Prevotella sp.]